MEQHHWRRRRPPGMSKPATIGRPPQPPAVGSPNQFYQFDNVTFNDGNNGKYTVNLSNAITPLTPLSVTVNTNGSYVLNGPWQHRWHHPGSDHGPAVAGTGSLTINNVNTYTGPTTINSGTVILLFDRLHRKFRHHHRRRLPHRRSKHRRQRRHRLPPEKLYLTLHHQHRPRRSRSRRRQRFPRHQHQSHRPRDQCSLHGRRRHAQSRHQRHDRAQRHARNRSSGGIDNLIASGRGTNGQWTSAGINSQGPSRLRPNFLRAPPPFPASSPRVELNNNGLGGTLLNTFDGQTVTITDVPVKYTYAGDADLPAPSPPPTTPRSTTASPA